MKNRVAILARVVWHQYANLVFSNVLPFLKTIQYGMLCMTEYRGKCTRIDCCLSKYSQDDSDSTGRSESAIRRGDLDPTDAQCMVQVDRDRRLFL